VDLGFQKFRTKKLQTTMTFDKEIGLRHSKNKSCSKWGKECIGQRQRQLGLWKFQNSIV